MQLELGSIPVDPRLAQALETLGRQMETDPNHEATIDSLLRWSRARIGTPYSQCLGETLRPEDPECPPGTDRFGSGYFDCSGFLTAAYAWLGISLPTTTDAMAIDLVFQESKIADTYSPEQDLPGDVLLMDGHVALSAGNGSIIHASGGQLIEEQTPSWVRNGVLAVYRPLAIHNG